jgi:hypothetical protein
MKDNYWPNTDVTVSREGSFATFSTLLQGLYTFRYKAVDKSLNTGYSDYRYVLVQAADDVNCVSGIKSVTDNEKQINVYPNPNNGQFTIHAGLSTSERVKITVTNIYGQEVAVISNSVLNNNSFQADLSTQPAGIYTISFVMKNSVITRQLVITK